MSEKSLSIKIRRARKELRIMQGEATNIYSYLTVTVSYTHLTLPTNSRV